MNRTVRRILFGFLFFAVAVSIIQIVRDRSFWLDEAFIADSIRTKTPAQILSAPSLRYNQQFPRIYLSLLAVLAGWVGPGTVSMRVIPMFFGLGGIAAWLYGFYEFYELRQRESMACVVAGGLLVASAYALYYSFELKQYSAEFCFAGILFALFQTKQISERKRILWLSLTALVSLLFTYTGLFMAAALGVSILFDKNERRLWWNERKTLIPYFLGECVLLGILYHIDYRYSETPGSSGTLHSYWASFFVEGNSIFQQISSLKNLYSHFLTDWWRTEYGPMSEDLVKPAGYLWPFRVMKNPDIRHVLFWLSLFVMGAKLIGKRLDRDPIYLGAWAVLLAVAMAACKIYPWGCSRLSLYLMPVSALIITESVLQISKWIARRLNSQSVSNLIWLPLGWLIARNMIYLLFVFALAPLPENLKLIVPYLNPSTPYLIISGASDVMVRAFPGIPPQIKVLYESEKGIPEIENIIHHQPAYYVWVHYPPSRDKMEYYSASAPVIKRK